jgi:ABC-type Zn uptake system ZnuABC Zn-binding protein ZnuA
MLLPLSAAALTALFGMSGCSQVKDGWEERPGPRVMVSFPPLYSFAKNVAGDDAQVRCLLVTTGPHEFKPSPQDAVSLRRADRFFVNGLGLDDQVARLKDDSGNHQLLVLPAGGSIPTTQLRDLEADEDEKGKGHTDHDHKHKHAHEGPQHEQGHHHGRYDPHVWLGIPEAIQMVGFIRDELIRIDPAHAAAYNQRAAAYVKKLQELHAEGKALLAGKQERSLISFHDSLYYFAKSFDLQIVESIERQAGSEPSPDHLAKLASLCITKKVRLIAVEPQYPKNTSADALLKEIQRKGVPAAEFIVIDPLESAASQDDLTSDFYERKMRANLKQLADALK